MPQRLTFVFPTKTTPVKEQMGHHSIQINVDTYGHLIPGANRRAAKLLATMVENPQPKGGRGLPGGVNPKLVTNRPSVKVQVLS
jgi:hypothetical protein